MSRITHWKTAALKAGVVLIPSCLTAYLTDKIGLGGPDSGSV